MRKSLAADVQNLIAKFDQLLAPLPLEDAIEAAEEFGSHVDAVLEAMRDDLARRDDQE